MSKGLCLISWILSTINANKDVPKGEQAGRAGGQPVTGNGHMAAAVLRLCSMRGWDFSCSLIQTWTEGCSSVFNQPVNRITLSLSVPVFTSVTSTSALGAVV